VALRITIDRMILAYNSYSQSNLRNFAVQYSAAAVVKHLNDVFHEALR